MGEKELDFVISLLKSTINSSQEKDNNNTKFNTNIFKLNQNKQNDFTFLPLLPFRPNNNDKLTRNDKIINPETKFTFRISPFNNHNFPEVNNRTGVFLFSKPKNNRSLSKNAESTSILSPITTYYDDFKKARLNPFYHNIRYLNFRPFINFPKIKNDSNETNSHLKYYYKLQGECLLVKNLLEDNGFVQCPQSSNDFTIFWSCPHIKLPFFKELSKWQRVNHFPRSVEIARKDLLYKNISKVKEMFPNSSKFNFIPISFLLPNEHKYLEEEMNKDNKVLWIIKPVASSQGKGIFIINNVNGIPNNSLMIASKYISNPFLINKKKFDLRIYALMTSVCPLRIYRYHEGLVRFAADDYCNDISDRCSHLTNYAVNKNNPKYIKNIDPEGNGVDSSKWNLTSFRKFLDDNGISSKTIFDKIDDIIIKTLISCENSLYIATRKYTNFSSNCFELYGFDILLDNTLNLWLLEVNHSPNLHYDAPIDLKIKGEMVAECFDLIRIIPYDLRDEHFSFGGKVNSMIDGIKELQGMKITKEEREILWETKEENKRTKNFKRIFPNNNYNEYRKYFDKERRINMILGIIDADKK